MLALFILETLQNFHSNNTWDASKLFSNMELNDCANRQWGDLQNLEARTQKHGAGINGN